MSKLRKCVVWDLDNTLWDGVCLETKVNVKPEVSKTVKELDSRGILNSIASRGDENLSLNILRENKLLDYFLLPQINWLPKSQSILKITSELNLSLDSIAFIDDDEFEREQISYMLPDVLTIRAEDAEQIINFPDFSPEEITVEAKSRRKLYLADMERKKAELNFKERKDFLLSCGMKLKIRQMNGEDVSRVLELMTRSHQLNTTGILLTNEDIINIHNEEKDRRKIYVAELEDKFGWYGIVGVAIYETEKLTWKLNYLAVSCRVMGRGIEKALLITLVNKALMEKFKTIGAEFYDTGRNKMMRGLYQMSGFISSIDERDPKRIIFYASEKDLASIPEWVEVL
jgi:FkbH-like protein